MCLSLVCLALAGCSGSRHADHGARQDIDLNSAAEAAEGDIANYAAVVHRSRRIRQ